MRVLILGGTRFLGRALADLAVRQGWTVTTFNRGVSGDDVDGVQAIRGDRTRQSDLEQLAALGPWDVVVDVPSVVPAHVRDAARALAPTCDRYVFVSTVSAYRDWPNAAVDEQSPLHEADPDADPGEWTWGTGAYSRLKAGAEAAIRRETATGQWLIVRPGVILGPHEYSARLNWWLDRAARGGHMVAPGDPGRHIQPIDVYDVAGFIWDRAAIGGGLYNLAAPIGRDTFSDLVGACVEVTGSGAVPVWIGDQALARAGIREWTELPLWRTAGGTWRVDTSKAQLAGLRCRPLRDTVAATWDWLTTGGRPSDDPRAAQHGLSHETEQRLLGQSLKPELPGFDRLRLRRQ